MSMVLVLGSIYFMIAFIGIIGNLIVLLVIVQEKRPWKNSIVYLFNLALADALFVTFLPLWAYSQLNNMIWSFGSSMCKFTGALTYTNMYASVFFITIMSIDRRSAIVSFVKYNSRQSSSAYRFFCAFLWIASIVLCVPSYMYRTLRPISHFRQNNSLSLEKNVTNDTTYKLIQSIDTSTTENVYVESTPMICVFYIPASIESKEIIMGILELIRSLIGFVFPFGIICFCYINMIYALRKGEISGIRRRMKNKATTTAVAIVVVFFICWVPYHVLNLYSALGGWFHLFQVKPNLYNKLKPYCICLAYANSCLNPILYAFSSRTFKAKMKETFIRKSSSSNSLPAKRRSTKVQIVQIGLKDCKKAKIPSKIKTHKKSSGKANRRSSENRKLLAKESSSVPKSSTDATTMSL